MLTPNAELTKLKVFKYLEFFANRAARHQSTNIYTATHAPCGDKASSRFIVGSTKPPLHMGAQNPLPPEIPLQAPAEPNQRRRGDY